MNTPPKPKNTETDKWLTTLAERAKALDAIFACGGEVEVAAPLTLCGPGGKKLEVIERIGFRPSNVDKKLRAWCAPASFGEGMETQASWPAASNLLRMMSLPLTMRALLAPAL